LKTDEAGNAATEPTAACEAVPTEIFVDGASRIDDVAERLGISLESRHYDTIAGYLMERAGDLPRVGYRHHEQGYSFTVIATTGHRIDEIRIVAEGAPS
jgi:putative hemolysin